MAKEYVGDGVYIDDALDRGYIIKLTTEDGIKVSNQIFIDYEMFKCINKYADKLIYIKEDRDGNNKDSVRSER